jgi:GxxExxY protein
MDENKLSNIIIGYAIKVHESLGPGLLESAYQECLCFELRRAGLNVEKEKALPLVYEDVKLDCGYRLDLVVEKTVIVEIKSVQDLHDIHLAQVITYLKLSQCKLGLLINFNVTKLKTGIRRIANNMRD